MIHWPRSTEPAGAGMPEARLPSVPARPGAGAGAQPASPPSAVSVNAPSSADATGAVNTGLDFMAVKGTSGWRPDRPENDHGTGTGPAGT
ncbi:hypothetical protein CYQ11_24570 [Streptomyces cinnamoneus]|nr:hypothetical protein CYQ11_24570 [Streptomyces cinnamoneus]